MTAKFWVGGTGTWDNATTTHWAISSGGAGGTAVPTTGDAVTFDGSSGGGTVTVDTTVSGLSLATLTCGAFTGTLDFSVNNPNMTISSAGSAFVISGTGVRTIKMGSGTFTFTGSFGNMLDCTTVTNLTLQASSCTIAYTATPNNQRGFNPGVGQTWGTWSVAGNSTNGNTISIGQAATINTLAINAPIFLSIQNLTVTNALHLSGTAYNNMFMIYNASGAGAATLTLAAGSTFNWCAFSNITVTNSPTATNSLDMQGVSGFASFTGPGGSSGGGIVGS